MLDWPNNPGLPCKFGTSSVASMVHLSGSLSPRGHTFPRSTALPFCVLAENFIVYHLSPCHGNGMVLENRRATCGGQERICNCWLLPIKSSVYRWAIKPISGRPSTALAEPLDGLICCSLGCSVALGFSAVAAESAVVIGVGVADRGACWPHKSAWMV